MERPKQDEVEDTQSRSTHDHNHARDDRHQPLEQGIESDRVGTPDTPEEDRMDKDRGA